MFLDLRTSHLSKDPSQYPNHRYWPYHIVDNQPFDCKTFVWKCMVISCGSWVRAKAFPLIILLMLRIWHSSSRYNFSSDAVWIAHRTCQLSGSERMRYVLCYGRRSRIFIILFPFSWLSRKNVQNGGIRGGRKKKKHWQRHSFHLWNFLEKSIILKVYNKTQPPPHLKKKCSLIS